ncbi:MAG: tRNA (adenosine(37)-N6)-threonylcarbamoyltransferase complex ATPase subunit type 1 TsaE [Alphaproteobacteria bacterium]|nr:tRNA (adenosine(37)-N6)-threonylcarbamoyltransferase complex ATPase subunit type 1 TsaE [Alphaproteobacteria bacterium]|tara:strand:- start:31 stop:534 length:504 start_codon:yes stop_codon:yes gene_type:complete
MTRCASDSAAAGQTETGRTFELSDEVATEALGAALAPLLARGDVLALTGDLGAGKTTLARGIVRSLGYRGTVPSPTFTLVQHYEIDPLPVAHFDLYRIGAADEIVELGFDEARAEGIVLLEWPERMGSYLPADRLQIALDYDAAGKARLARVRGPGDWAERLRALSP